MAERAKWEQRWHPLREEWVVVAAHRQNRPWSGQTEGADEDAVPNYDPSCYLCPGNPRISGARNPDYTGIHVFDNDHPCVGPAAPRELEPAPGIYRRAPANGLARVVCYGPEHHLRLAELPLPRVVDLLRCWQDQYRELGAHPEIDHVLVFENNGPAVGVSNPHPHCQIYATNFVFRTMQVELAAEERHRHDCGRGLMTDILRSEREDGRRIIAESPGALGFVPWFARYAYEAYVVPEEPHPSIADLAADEIDALAATLRQVLVRYDNLWQMPMPYVLALHNAPTDGGDHAHAHHHFHIQIHPPLRKPDLLKFLAGPEVGGGNFIADTWPEDCAAELQACSEGHYRNREDA